MYIFILYIHLYNIYIYIYILFLTLQKSLESINFYITGKVKFPFTKSFSGAKINPVVNKCLNG